MLRYSVFALLTVALSGCAKTVPQEAYDQAQATITAAQSLATQEHQSLERAISTASAKGTEVASLTSDLATAEAARSDASSHASRLKTKVDLYECPESLSGMKYTGIADASTILAAFVAGQSWSERVQGTFRDSIWTSTDSKLHGVRYIASSDHKPYTTYFMVYFDEDYGWERGVYWVDRQCWLDRE